jgi:WD40 repeat protein
MVWLVNALSGKIMASLAGHDSDVTYAMFTQHDQHKHVVSSSADCTLKVWKPLQNECVLTARPVS